MPTSRFTDATEEQFAILIFLFFVSIFDTGSLCSFKSKVIRVLFKLESPNSEHRNSSYVQNNSDYSMIKTEIRILACAWPHFELIFEPLRAIILQCLFLYGWFSLKTNLIDHLNHSNRIGNEQVMVFSCQLVGLQLLPRNSLQY